MLILRRGIWGLSLQRIFSVLAVCALAGVIWAGGAATNAESTTARALPSWADADADAALLQAETVKVETDLERRQRLNDRLKIMVASGEGSRLTDKRTEARAARSAQPQTGAIVRAISQPQARAAGPARIETSTIAPPAGRSSGNYIRTGFYTPPRLDLTTPPVVPTDDVECLTQALYYEARNESEDGQAAVAEVIINRSRAGTYPRKICEVVYQRNTRTCQFTFTCDGSIGRGRVNMNAWGRAERIARSVYEGRSSAQLPKNSVNYHANYVRPSWGARLQRVRQIGAHIFYGAALNGHVTPGSEPNAPFAPRSSGLVFAKNEAWERAYAESAHKDSDGAASGGVQ